MAELRKVTSSIGSRLKTLAIWPAQLIKCRPVGLARLRPDRLVTWVSRLLKELAQTRLAQRVSQLVSKWGWLIAVIAVALIIVTGTVVAGVLLTQSYSDSTHRLTAWASLLAGATLVVAVLGLPVALYQLSTVRRDLDRVTRAGDFERGLNDLMLPGVDLLERFHQRDDADMRAELRGWVEVVAQYIRDETGNEVEERLFRLEGQALGPRDQLERKILHLRDKLIPKVRAGYW